MTFQSGSPYTTYARWNQVDIYKDRAELHERPEWKEPDRGQFVIDCLNRDGGKVEKRDIGNQVIALPKGIPIKVSVTLESPWIWYQRFEVVRLWERQEASDFPGYYKMVPMTKDVRTPRSTTETLWIKGLMLAQGLKTERMEEPQVEEEIFQTVFENKSDNPAKVWADNGRPFFSIGPGQRFYLEAYDPKAMYARFKNVTFKKGGSIDVEENGKWKPPWTGYTIKLTNLTFASQGITLNSRNVFVPPGIPVTSEVRLEEADANYKSITWKLTIKLVPREDLPGYFDEVTVSECIKEPRSPKELEQIMEERKALVVRRHSRGAAKHQRSFASLGKVHD
jgi:hypothetical protein